MKNGTLSGFHGEGHMMNALGGQSLLTHFPVFLIIFYVIFFFKFRPEQFDLFTFSQTVAYLVSG